jgi:uncharacterized protein
MKCTLFGMRRAACTAAMAVCFSLIVICAPAAADGPAIWRVEGGPKPVWLFGTFHLLPPGTEWRTPLVGAAFENADVLVVEARLDDEAIAATQKIIMEKAFLKDGKKLRDYLGPEDQAAYEKTGNRLGLFPAILDYYRPWYASVLLSVALYWEQGFRPDAGVDMVLQKRAEAEGKPVEQFETASEQLDFLAGMSEKEQVAMLKATLREAENVPGQIGAMLRAWESGDTKSMDEMFNQSLRAFPEAYDRLLVQRNKNWLPRIEEMIADGKGYFIAVGSTHLVGEDSVIALLRAKGYEVTGP